MNFLPFFKPFPFPLATVATLLVAAAGFSCMLLYNRLFYMRRRRGRALILSQFWYKFPFLALLSVCTVASCLAWYRTKSLAYASPYIFAGASWTSAMSGDALKNVTSVCRVDAFGAASAALLSFAALAAGLRALADRENVITPRSIVFYLISMAGIYGTFYLDSLILLSFSLLITQLGVTGLYSNFSAKKNDGGKRLCYYVSRVVLLLTFAAGVLLLTLKYGSDAMGVIALGIMPDAATLWAFIFLVTPLLYIFMKPSPYMPDAARDCFFALRTQASLFLVFRVIFSLYGPMRGLEKIPALFMILGFASVILAILLSACAKEPERLMNSVVFYMKGTILVSIGIAMNGTFSAERAAFYGVSALEAMISLWLIFMPVSTALAIITVYLKQKSEDGELWQAGGLLKKAPFTLLSLFFAFAVLGGLPPFIGYAGKQLLFRSAIFISPFAAVALFLFTLAMLLSSMRFLASLAFGEERFDQSKFAGEADVALPLIVMLLLFFGATVAPGGVFDGSVAPAAEALINRASPFAPAEIAPTDAALNNAANALGDAPPEANPAADTKPEAVK